MSKPKFQRILVAFDGSESSGRASLVATEMAEKFKSELIVLHAISAANSRYPSSFVSAGPVVPPIPQKEIDAYYAYARRVLLGIVSETVAEAKKRGVTARTELPEGVSSVVETIVNHATKENVDLIVIGTGGWEASRRYFWEVPLAAWQVTPLAQC